MKYKLPTNSKEAIGLLAICEFKPFDKADAELFSGGRMPGIDPEICYLEGDDGNGLAVIHETLFNGTESYYFHSFSEETVSPTGNYVEFTFLKGGER